MAGQQDTAGLPIPAAARLARRAPWLVCLLVGGLTFFLAYERGSFEIPTRNAVAVAVWWGVIVAAVAGLAAPVRAAGGAAAAAACLAAFALWTLASTAWASSAEDAFSEFDRVCLYLGVFVLVCLVARRRHLPAWCAGLGLGVLAVGVLALSSRRAVAAAVCGVLAFLLLTARRWLALGMVVLALVGAAAAVAVLAHNPAVANGRVTAAQSGVALALLGIAVLTAAVCAGLAA